MNNTYDLIFDIDLLAEEIGNTLKENHISTSMVDRSNFTSETSRCQIDTYQVFELNRRGYITINVYFFRPDWTSNNIQVKFSIFSPLWNESSMKMRKLHKEIDSIIRTHIA